MTELYIQDVTLRDGMHAIRHRVAPETVARIVKALDEAGVDAIEVTHGDGIAGGSLNYGPGSNTDWEWIEAAASVLQHAKLTSLLVPGIGTIEGLKEAYSLGVRSVRVATHCTEADVAAQHIATAREIGMDVSGFLMMSHMNSPEGLAQQAKLMESYGAQCVYVTDSGRPAHHGRGARPGARLPGGARPRDPDRHPRAREPLVVGGQLGGRGRGGRLPRRRLAGGPGSRGGQHPDRGVRGRGRPPGLEPPLRRVQAAGRRRRPGPAPAGPARAGGPGDAHPRLRRASTRRSCATPRSPRSATGSMPGPCCSRSAGAGWSVARRT